MKNGDAAPPSPHPEPRATSESPKAEHPSCASRFGRLFSIFPQLAHFRGGRWRQIPHPGKNGLGGPPPNLQTKSTAFENYKGQQRAYQSRKGEDEYYQHGTHKLCIETTRPLRRVATQQRYDDAYSQQKMWGKEEKTGNPFPEPHFSPSPAGDIHNPAERQNNYTRHEQPDPLHSRTIGRFRYSRKISIAGRSTIKRHSRIANCRRVVLLVGPKKLLRSGVLRRRVSFPAGFKKNSSRINLLPM